VVGRGGQNSRQGRGPEVAPSRERSVTVGRGIGGGNVGRVLLSARRDNLDYSHRVTRSRYRYPRPGAIYPRNLGALTVLLGARGGRARPEGRARLRSAVRSRSARSRTRPSMPSQACRNQAGVVPPLWPGDTEAEEQSLSHLGASKELVRARSSGGRRRRRVARCRAARNGAPAVHVSPWGGHRPV